MHFFTLDDLQRESFLPGIGAPMLRKLLDHDGSMTRLLEEMTGTEISVHIVDQHAVRELPGEIDGVLPGSRFLRRVSCLEANGQVLLDSLSYVAMDVLPAPMLQDLEEGIRPIGHVLAPLPTRREFRKPDSRLFNELWNVVGHPDPIASRSSCICTSRVRCVLLAETFRGGVLRVAKHAASRL